MTINPEVLQGIGNFKIKDMSSFPGTSLISIKTLCKDMRHKLRMVYIETEFEIIKRKIEEIKKKLEDKPIAKEKEYQLILAKIEEVYQEISKLPKGISTNLSVFMNRVVSENNISINTCSTPNNEIKKPQYTMEDLSLKIQELDKRTSKVEKKIEALESQIMNYLVNGGNNPLENSHISKMDLIKILIGFNPKTQAEKQRRNNLLKTLKISSLAFATMALLLKSDSYQKNIELTSESTSNGVVTIEEFIPIVPSPSTIFTPDTIETPTKKFENQNRELKSIEELAIEVIRGNWQDDAERKILLSEAGYDADTIKAIQNLVNDILYGKVSLEEIYSKVENQKLNR